LKSKIVKLRVAKKPEKRQENLLEAEDDDNEANDGIWDSIAGN